eukprot:tig00001249_g7789.t1
MASGDALRKLDRRRSVAPSSAFEGQVVVQPGSRIWIPDADEGFVRGVVREMRGAAACRVLLDSGKESEAALRDVLPAPATGAGEEGDGERENMCGLELLHEAAVLDNLRRRHAARRIYTWSGATLVAVNPYQALPLYGPDAAELYRSAPDPAGPPRTPPRPRRPPLAAAALKGLEETGAPQAILVSGESGAGKTETTKLLLQYVTGAGDAAARPAGTGRGSVEGRLLEACAVLEAFGNAKTLRNDNSSRFGRFFQLFMEGPHRIVGARVTNYLLEKSRVVLQSAGERNYHVFYQLCASAPPALRERLGLGAANKYNMLTGGSCTAVEGVDDAAGFVRTCEALRAVGLDEEDLDSLWAVLAGLLHLSNVTFAAPASASDPCAVASDQPFGRACELLGVDPAALRAGLTTQAPRPPPRRRPRPEGTRRTRVVAQRLQCGREESLRHRDADQAKEARDALIKTAYQRVFEWLARRVNEALGAEDPAAGEEPEGRPYLAILDVFGFEVFE